MRSSNPALSDKAFEKGADDFAGVGTTTLAAAGGRTGAMTVQGTAVKTLLLLVILVIAGAFPWYQFSQGNLGLVNGLLIGGLIAGLVTALITIFKPKAAPWTAPLYALFEGLVLGGISAIFEQQFPGIVVEAIGATFGVMFVMLFLYVTRIVKVTRGFMIAVISATGGIFVFYLVSFLLQLFGVSMDAVWGNSPLAIGITVVIVIVAALNLMLDFNSIEKGAGMGQPKYFEWYGAFGLLVTLVWLYLEMLRLLSQLRN